MLMNVTGVVPCIIKCSFWMIFYVVFLLVAKTSFLFILALRFYLLKRALFFYSMTFKTYFAIRYAPPLITPIHIAGVTA